MPPKKPEAPKNDYFVEVMAFLIVIFFLWMVFTRIQYYMVTYNVGTYHSLWMRFLHFFFTHIWPLIKFLGVIVVGLSVVGIVYSYQKLKKIVLAEHLIYHPVPEPEAASTPSAKNPKWDRVLAHSNSINPSDWKLAIIEADTMLDELLKTVGYHGESLGERLKAVEKSDFLTIDYAWEAHKIRNQIAHQGADFDLTSRETKRVVTLYEAVFKEFQII